MKTTYFAAVYFLTTLFTRGKTFFWVKCLGAIRYHTRLDSCLALSGTFTYVFDFLGYLCLQLDYVAMTRCDLILHPLSYTPLHCTCFYDTVKTNFSPLTSPFLIAFMPFMTPSNPFPYLSKLIL